MHYYFVPLEGWVLSMSLFHHPENHCLVGKVSPFLFKVKWSIHLQHVTHSWVTTNNKNKGEQKNEAKHTNTRIYKTKFSFANFMQRCYSTILFSKKREKRGGKVFNLISLKFEALGGKFTPIPCHSYALLLDLWLKWSSLSLSLVLDLHGVVWTFETPFPSNFWMKLCYFRWRTRLSNHLDWIYMF